MHYSNRAWLALTDKYMKPLTVGWYEPEPTHSAHFARLVTATYRSNDPADCFHAE